MSDDLDREIEEALPREAWEVPCEYGRAHTLTITPSAYRARVRALVERRMVTPITITYDNTLEQERMAEARGAAKALEGLAEWIQREHDNGRIFSSHPLPGDIAIEALRRAKGEK